MEEWKVLDLIYIFFFLCVCVCVFLSVIFLLLSSVFLREFLHCELSHQDIILFYIFLYNSIISIISIILCYILYSEPRLYCNSDVIIACIFNVAYETYNIIIFYFVNQV